MSKLNKVFPVISKSLPNPLIGPLNLLNFLQFSDVLILSSNALLLTSHSNYSCISMSRFRFWWDIYWEMLSDLWTLVTILPSSELPLHSLHSVCVCHRKIFTLHSLCNTLPFPELLIQTTFCVDIQIFTMSEWLVSVIIKAIIILGIVRVFHKTTFIAAKTISWMGFKTISAKVFL